MKEPSSPTDGSQSHAVVVTENAQDVVHVDLDRWGRLAEAVLRAEGESGELTLTFVDAADIIELLATLDQCDQLFKEPADTT